MGFIQPLKRGETVYWRQFDWGGRLQKRIGGVQKVNSKRISLFVEHNSKCLLDCVTDTFSRETKDLGYSDPIALCGKAIA